MKIAKNTNNIDLIIHDIVTLHRAVVMFSNLGRQIFSNGLSIFFFLFSFLNQLQLCYINYFSCHFELDLGY